ncbi:hypothetical protein [Paenibacillus sp. UNC451MF]|uniref:hypothetical protein n=1 Tax=Paenibacillus sp. UNC451MF TaxID=1449063 RepID=UPI00048AEE05|nr:hypothetical protein [Paenibacillus sp. UNC451MF]
MLPLYGNIALFLLLIILIPGVCISVYFGAVKKNESKMMAAIAMTLLPCIPLFIMLVSAGNQKDENEIEAQILSMGGTIILIEKVSSKATPFKPVHKTFGAHFKIQYSLNGQKHIAWFRGDRAMIQSPQPTFSEKWILKY